MHKKRTVQHLQCDTCGAMHEYQGVVGDMHQQLQAAAQLWEAAQDTLASVGGWGGDATKEVHHEVYDMLTRCLQVCIWCYRGGLVCVYMVLQVGTWVCVYSENVPTMH